MKIIKDSDPSSIEQGRYKITNTWWHEDPETGEMVVRLSYGELEGAVLIELDAWELQQITIYQRALDILLAMGYSKNDWDTYIDECYDADGIFGMTIRETIEDFLLYRKMTRGHV